MYHSHKQLWMIWPRYCIEGNKSSWYFKHFISLLFTHIYCLLHALAQCLLVVVGWLDPALWLLLHRIGHISVSCNNRLTHLVKLTLLSTPPWWWFVWLDLVHYQSLYNVNKPNWHQLQLWWLWFLTKKIHWNHYLSFTQGSSLFVKINIKQMGLNTYNQYQTHTLWVGTSKHEHKHNHLYQHNI